jgi:hypothetical protein
LLSLLEAGMRHPKERGSENANGEGFWGQMGRLSPFFGFFATFSRKPFALARSSL